MVDLLNSLNKKQTSFEAVLANQNTVRKATPDQVELIIASAGHQFFGILMSQVSNIMRPGPAGLQVLSPSALSNRLYSEVAYQGGRLRVLELSRQLFLPLVEPIERCKILLTDPTHGAGRGEMQFGVAVDDIVTLRQFNLSDLRLLPRWLCGNQLGKLIWGAVLIAPETLAQDNVTSALPTPFQFEAEMVAPPLVSSEPLRRLEIVPALLAKNSLNLAERLTQRERRVEQVGADSRRPLILLDLQVLYSEAFPGIT